MIELFPFRSIKVGLYITEQKEDLYSRKRSTQHAESKPANKKVSGVVILSEAKNLLK
jgi:hypothetical protein